ncbi:MAG: glycosyltransferase [Gemmataceae bacterium]
MPHFLLLPVGSHGDVHPFVALGQGLRQRGHRVTMITSEPFRGLAERNGFEFVSTITTEEYDSFMVNPDLWKPNTGLRVIFDHEKMRKYLPIVYEMIRSRYVPGDTVAVAGTLSYATRIAQESLGIPLATVHLQPMSCCSVDDPPVASNGRDFTWMPRPVVRLAYWVAERWITDPLAAPPINDFRRSLSPPLPPVKRILMKWSPSPQRVLALFPEWFGPIPDGGPAFRHAGFLPYDDANGRPTPGHVQQFIEAGPAPVIFSFGSAMRMGRPYFEAAIDACRRLNIRGILLGKSGDQIPADRPANVFHADYAPFSEVFPQAACVVHHGGIGTSAQGMKAGVPQLIMPMAFDQADNAARMKRLGIAETLFPKRFTGPNLARALKSILARESMRQRAREIRTRFAGPDTVTKACQFVEELVGMDRA